MKYISNAFSLNMLTELTCLLVSTEFNVEESKNWLSENQPTSVVGHPDTAQIMSKVLNTTVVANRATVNLQPGDSLLVGQYVGPRLPEGATVLPEGASFKWVHISLVAR